MFRLYNDNLIPRVDSSDILVDFVMGKLLIMRLRVYGIEFDKVPTSSYETVDVSFYVNIDVPVLLFVFVEHFDMVYTVEYDEFDLLVLDDVLDYDVVGLAD